MSRKKLQVLPDDDLHAVASEEYRRAAEALLGKLPSNVEEHHEVMRAAWNSSPALREEMRRLLARVEVEAAKSRKEEAEIREAFLRERMEEIPDWRQPTKAEQQDLSRRLLAAVMEAAGDEPRMNVPGLLAERSKVPLVRFELERLFGVPLGDVESDSEGGVILSEAARDAFLAQPYHRIELALVWPEVWHGWRDEHAPELAARMVLARDESKEAAEKGAHGYLEEIIREELRRAKEVFGAKRVGYERAHLLLDDQRDGMLAVDADAADFLAKISREHAETFRKNRREALTCHLRALEMEIGTANQPPPPWRYWADWLSFARDLGAALWEVKGRPEFQRRRTQATPALLFAVMESVTLVATQGLEIGKDERGQLSLFRPNLVKPKHGRPVAVADAPDLQAVPPGIFPEVMAQAMQIALKLPGGYLAIPYVEALATASQQLFFQGKEGQRVDTVGGWTAFAAQLMGVPPERVRSRDRADIRRLGWVLATTPIRWTDGSRSSALFLIEEDALVAGKGRGRGVLTHVLSSRLQYGEHFRARENRQEAATPDYYRKLRLVPLFNRMIPALPRSKRNTRGPQVVFSRRVSLYFVDRREEMAAEGFVRIEPARALEIARASQLPEKYAMPMLEWMVEQGVLQSDGQHGFAPADEAARRFIAEGAKKAEEAARRAARRGRARGRR